MDERRKIQRFDLETPARIEVGSEEVDKNVLSLTTRDISSNGAFLYTEDPLPLGSSVQLELLLSLEDLHRIVGERGTARVRVRGEVVRAEGSGMAVLFDKRYKIIASNNRN